MRGTVGVVGGSQSVMGITPADAGNRPAFPSIGCWGKDHPRGCGEQRATLDNRGEPKGSPPRMRGTVRSTPRLLLDTRITPADAGNSVPVLDVVPSA